MYVTHAPVPAGLAPAATPCGPRNVQRSILVCGRTAAEDGRIPRILREAGYSPTAAGADADALKLAERRPVFSVVLLETSGTTPDGLHLLEALRARNYRGGRFRAICLARTRNFDHAVAALRLGAVDYLTPPLEMPRLVAAIEKAAGEAEGASRSQPAPAIAEELARAATALAEIAARLGQEPAGEAHQPPPGGHPQQAVLRRALRAVRTRATVFGNGLFADPVWSMFLEIAQAELEGRRISTTSACLAAHVPGSTALRRIADLEAERLVYREPDTSDGRRSFVRCTELGLQRFLDYAAQLA